MKKNRLSKLSLKQYPNTYLFDESENEHGTTKDRRNRMIMEEAQRLHVDKLVLITSGNNGYSLAQMARDTGIKVVCVVSRRLDEEMKALLRSVAYQVIEMNLDQKILRPEELITVARETDEEVIWDVTNGYEDAYAAITKEIERQLKPDYIVCPVGSGGLFIGLVEGARLYVPKTKIIGIGTREAHQSYADKLSTPWTPYARAIENAAKGGHVVYRLSEQQIKDVFKKYKHYGRFEPSSAVVFAAFDVHPFKQSDTVVLINSGKLAA